MEVDTKHGILKDTLASLSDMGMTYIKCERIYIKTIWL